jgi:hypothetical protein
MTKKKMAGPTNMKMEVAWNGLHLAVDDDESNYNLEDSPFTLFGEK